MIGPLAAASIGAITALSVCYLVAPGIFSRRMPVPDANFSPRLQQREVEPIFPERNEQRELFGEWRVTILKPNNEVRISYHGSESIESSLPVLAQLFEAFSHAEVSRPASGAGEPSPSVVSETGTESTSPPFSFQVDQTMRDAIALMLEIACGNMLSAGLNASKLITLGKQIEQCHPLLSLWEMMRTEKNRNYLIRILDSTYFTIAKDKLLEGVTTSLSSKKHTPEQFRQFAALVNQNPAALANCYKERGCEAFIRVCIKGASAS